MAVVLRNVTGDVFVGEAKLFFVHPRCAKRSPYRLETSDAGRNTVSFEVRVFKPNMIVMCDTAMNAARITESLYASDIAGDTEVRAFEPENAGRWTNLVETSDGRHWSEGEKVSSQRPANSNDRPRRTVAAENGIARLNAQLPREAVVAVEEGRAIVFSRQKNLHDYVWGGRSSGNVGGGVPGYDLKVCRVARSFNNQVFSLCRVRASDGVVSEDAAALLIVGMFWPTNDGVVAERLPRLTVARQHPGGRSGGGRVFYACLGNRLAESVVTMSSEELAKTKRHYEGYFSALECESFSKRE